MFTHATSLWPLVQIQVPLSPGVTTTVFGSVIVAHLSHGPCPDDVDRPPVAFGGQDRVVQPQDSLTLNGIESKDDQKIVSYQWQMLTNYPYAVIEVS